MSPKLIFQIQLILGYVAWLLLFRAYVLPWLASMPRIDAHRAMATLQSFRWIGLVFILPGVIGPDNPREFAIYGAYGDLATGLLAILALITIRMRPLFWTLVVAYNVVGAVDLLGDYYLAIHLGVLENAGRLGATYFIPVLYVPIALITHALAFYWLVRPNSGGSSRVAAAR